MSTNNFFKSDLPRIHNIVQNSMLVYPKEIIIATLRNYFSDDSYYHYSKDQWGFANTTDHTDLPLGADLPSGPGAYPELSNVSPLSTRIFIGENYRYDGIHYPAILVKSGGGRYVPISINREQGAIQNETIVFEDGYGHQKLISVPKSFITAGVWEGSFTIDILTRSLRARDDLMEAVSICLNEISFDTLVDIGIIIKPTSWSAPSETDDRSDKLFRQSISVDVRSEWRREIPISNVIDTILFTITLENLDVPNYPVPQNITIRSEVSIFDGIIGFK